MMKNWPSAKYSFPESLRYKMSEKFLMAVQGKDKLIGVKIPKNIVNLRDHWLQRGDREKTSCPDGLKIKTLQVAYGDLFFLEEFSRLQRGITHLNRDCGDEIFGVKEKEIIEWFESAKRMSFGRAADKPFGYFYLDRLKQPRCFRLTKMVSLEIKHFSPSMMALTIIVTPSEEFKRRFQLIISSNSLPIVDIRFSIRFGTFLYSTSSPVFRRKRDIDNLFLEINKEITILMRKYFGVGLSKYGPLPSLEILLIDNSLDFISERGKAIKDDSFMRRAFWEGLGLDVFSGGVYSMDSAKLYEIDRDRNYKVDTYQLLESVTDFTSSSVKEEDGGKKEEIILDHYRYFLPELCPMLALKQLFKVQEEEILCVRNNLAPVLSNQTFGTLSFRTLGRWISRLVNMNELHFRQQRAVSEMAEKFTETYLTRELTGILGKK